MEGRYPQHLILPIVFFESAIAMDCYCSLSSLKSSRLTPPLLSLALSFRLKRMPRSLFAYAKHCVDDRLSSARVLEQTRKRIGKHRGCRRSVT